MATIKILNPNYVEGGDLPRYTKMSTDVSVLSYLQDLVASKANDADVYKKTETYSRELVNAQISDYVDPKLINKFNTSDFTFTNIINELVKLEGTVDLALMGTGVFRQVLATDNTTEYTPSEDYHPSTKKYVDGISTTLDNKIKTANDNIALKADLSNTYTKTETNQAINTAISNLVDGAPEALNTLNELAAALLDKPDTVTGILSTLDEKANSSDLDNYLAKDNTTIFNPTAPYHPATKAYVDTINYKINITTPLSRVSTLNSASNMLAYLGNVSEFILAAEEGKAISFVGSNYVVLVKGMLVTSGTTKTLKFTTEWPEASGVAIVTTTLSYTSDSSCSLINVGEFDGSLASTSSGGIALAYLTGNVTSFSTSLNTTLNMNTYYFQPKEGITTVLFVTNTGSSNVNINITAPNTVKYTNEVPVVEAGKTNEISVMYHGGQYYVRTSESF